MIERVVYLGELYDLYGPLLTNRQREVFELYYLDDLSLGEIAEECGISRQGVHDLLRRSEKALIDYEKLLGFRARRRFEREQIEKALDLMAADPAGARLLLEELLGETKREEGS